jgi:hypothetical protein
LRQHRIESGPARISGVFTSKELPFMKHAFTRQTLAIVSILFAAVLQAGCGGGGGGEDAPAGNGGGGNADTAAVLNPGLTGKFVSRELDSPDYYATDASTGRPTKVGRRTDPKQVILPTRSGKYLFGYAYDTGNEVSTIELYDATRPFGPDSLIYREENFPGDIRGVESSADGRYLSMVYTPIYSDKNIRRGYRIFDMAKLLNQQTGVVVRDEAPRTGAFVQQVAWRADGKFNLIRADLTIVEGDPAVAANTDRVIGAFKPPAGYNLPGNFSLSPDGTQWAVEHSWSDGFTARDIWIYSVDGDVQRRLTADKLSFAPQWSFDGKYVAMGHSTGKLCVIGEVSAGCVGECFWWYVPSTVTEKRLVDGGASIRTYGVGSAVATNMNCYQDYYWVK